MMDYETFKEAAEKKLAGYLGSEYEGMEIVIRKVNKVGCLLDGIFAKDPEAKEEVRTVLYLEDMYEQYKESGSLEKTLARAADTMKAAAEYENTLKTRLDFGKAKDNIVFQIISTEQNRSLLSNVPNRRFLDLSVIYRWVIDEDGGNIVSAVVDNSMAEYIGMTEDELFKAATDNTRRITPPVICTMSDVMRDITDGIGMLPELEEVMNDIIPEKMQMYVIRNEYCVSGAACMLYDDIFYDLAGKLGTDLYIIPSSVHEVIAVSTAANDAEELTQMVKKVNAEKVEPDERLSDHVYYYDRNLRKLCVAAGT